MGHLPTSTHSLMSFMSYSTHSLMSYRSDPVR